MNNLFVHKLGLWCFTILSTFFVLAGCSVNGVSTLHDKPGLSAIAIEESFAQHTCSVVSDESSGDQIYCWGHNNDGQLGNGTIVDSVVPVAVNALRGKIAAISTDNSIGAHHHSCAVVDGAAWCWGNNDHGQLGNGTQKSSAEPVVVTGLEKNVSDISAGSDFTCAVVDGAVLCWGKNINGQLGNGLRKDSLVPVAVNGITRDGTPDSLPDRTLIVGAGDRHTCALAKTGRVWCWGNNDQGQLGDGTQKSSAIPTLVKRLANVSLITVGNAHNCARIDDTIPSAKMQCWGDNRHGQLGNPSQKQSYSVMPVAAGPVDDGDITGMTAGKDRTCAVKRAGELYCWGRPWGQQEKELGTYRATPQIIGKNVLTVHVGNDSLCWVEAVVRYDTPTGIYVGKVPPKVHSTSSTGKVFCWSYTQNDAVALADTGNFAIQDPAVKASAVAIGNHHICAIFNGAAWCWGDNKNGQLGVGTGNDWLAQPVVVHGLESGVTALSAAEDYTCAIAHSGVWCWGKRDYLFPDSDESNLPRSILGLQEGATAISVGEHVSCAIVKGAAWCWGDNASNQLGHGGDSYQHSKVPVRVVGFDEGVTAISVGDDVVAAITETKAPLQERNLDNPPDKDGDNAKYTNGPKQAISREIKVATISTGDKPMAASAKARVWFWGHMMGNEYTTPQANEEFPDGATSVSAGDGDICAVIEGRVWCFGHNAYGQLGNGVYKDDWQYKPVAVKGVDAGATMSGFGRHNTHGNNCAVVKGALLCWGYAYGLDPIPLIDAFKANITDFAIDNYTLCAIQNASLRCMELYADGAWARKDLEPELITTKWAHFIKTLSAH